MSGTLLAAHGTRSATGRACVEDLRRALQERLGQPVRLGWVDVVEPRVEDLVRDGDVILPAFLGEGHHVTVDLPTAAALAEDVTVTPHLGCDGVGDLLRHALLARVREAGGPWPTTIIGWAGSSHLRSQRQASRLRARLAQEWAREGVRVELATPREVPGLVAAARSRGEEVGIASHLLAPGFFHDRLAACGAAATTEPLGAHPAVVEALAQLHALALSPRQSAVVGEG